MTSTDGRIGVLQKLLCGAIRFYRLAISPLKPRCCRFEPSCSQYAIDAIMIHGIFKGCGLALWRLLRCHPFYNGPLYDPVPLPKGCRHPSGGNEINTPNTETPENRSSNDG